MTHTQILLRELVKHGKVTYAQLDRWYGDDGYNREGFAAAVFRARKDGVVAPSLIAGAIVAVGECPCCGRAIGKGK